jgi:hypothetical protein
MSEPRIVTVSTQMIEENRALGADLQWFMEQAILDHTQSPRLGPEDNPAKRVVDEDEACTCTCCDHRCYREWDDE